MLKIATFVALLVTGLAAQTAQAQQINITADEARAIARDAWVLGMPLVYIEKQIDTNTYVVKSEGSRAPINQFAHYRKFPDASDTHRVILGQAAS